MRTTSGDFVNQIFNTGDSVFTKRLFNDSVVGNGDSLTIDLSKTSLVDELGNSLSGGITIK